MSKKVFKEMYEQMKPDAKIVVDLHSKIDNLPRKQTFSSNFVIATVLLLVMLSSFLLQSQMGKGKLTKVGLSPGYLPKALLYQLPNEMGKYVCELGDFADYVKPDNPAVLMLDGRIYYEFDRFLSCYNNNNESVWSLSTYVGETKLIDISEVPKENFDSTIHGFLFTFHYHKNSPFVIMLTPSSEVIIFMSEQ